MKIAVRYELSCWPNPTMVYGVQYAISSIPKNNAESDNINDCVPGAWCLVLGYRGAGVPNTHTYKRFTSHPCKRGRPFVTVSLSLSLSLCLKVEGRLACPWTIARMGFSAFNELPVHPSSRLSLYLQLALLSAYDCCRCSRGPSRPIVRFCTPLKTRCSFAV